MIDIIIFKILILINGLNPCVDRENLQISENQEISCYIDSKTNKTIIVENELIFVMSYGVRMV